MTRSLVEQCLDLAWSQWASLGVSGSGVLVPSRAVDLEAAIAFAPLLADLDPRLHDEVLDWCIQFARHFTSVSSLKHCLKLFDSEHRDAFDEFAAIVNKHGGTKWPTTHSKRISRSLKPSEKSTCRLDRPSAVQLRGRKIFGINARADILVGLALEPQTTEPRWTHVNLLLDLGYTKRSLSEALNDLKTGGMLGAMKFGNTIRYALQRGDALRAMLAPLPETVGQPWAQRLALAASLISVSFAIPIERVREVVGQMRDIGHVTRSWLGTTVLPINAERAQQVALPKVTGALVTGVEPSSPAARAQLRAGDVILKWDGREVDHVSLPNVVSQTPPGKTVTVAIWRNKVEMPIVVVTEKMPQ